MMCGVTQENPQPERKRAVHSTSASLRLIPAHHVPPVVLLSLFSCVLCQCRCESPVSLRCLCPALRIHNHTVLPSSHNSSYVYTNDSAYTNISATVGEDQITEIHVCASPAAPCCPLCIYTVVAEHFSRTFLLVLSFVPAAKHEEFINHCSLVQQEL